MSHDQRLARLERGDDPRLSERELRDATVRVAKAFDLPVEEVADELREALALPRSEINRLYAELSADHREQVTAALEGTRQ